MFCGLFGKQPCHLQATTRGGECDHMSVLHISALQTPLQVNRACDEETRKFTLHCIVHLLLRDCRDCRFLIKFKSAFFSPFLLTVKPNSAQKWWKLNHNLREKHMSGHNRAKKSALWDKSWLFISNFQLCVPYLLPFTQSSHSWRIIRTAVSGSCLLTSAQHSTQSNPRSWSGDLALLAWEQHPADRHLSINAQHLEPPRTMCSARSCSHCSPTTALPDIRGNSTVNYVDNTTTITIVRIRNNNESSWDGTNITENQSWWSHITTLA